MAFYPTRVRYGLRLLTRLALHDKDQRLSVGDIAAEESVSVKYLEQIVGALKPLGVLRSVRGAHGGYTLAKDPADICLRDVFECLGGLDTPVPCINEEEACDRKEVCTTYPFWAGLDAHIREYLAGRTLADVVAEAPAQIAEHAGAPFKDGCAPRTKTG